MEIEVKENNVENQKTNNDILTFEGYITPAKAKYKRKTFVKPIEYHLIAGTGAPYTKYVCPVCQALGNDNIVYKFDKTCPLCNVNLLWDEEDNEITYGEKKDIRKRTNNWHVTGFIGKSESYDDIKEIDYVLTVDYFLTRDDIIAALIEKYIEYCYADFEIEIINERGVI